MHDTTGVVAEDIVVFRGLNKSSVMKLVHDRSGTLACRHEDRQTTQTDRKVVTRQTDITRDFQTRGDHEMRESHGPCLRRSRIGPKLLLISLWLEVSPGYVTIFSTSTWTQTLRPLCTKSSRLLT